MKTFTTSVLLVALAVAAVADTPAGQVHPSPTPAITQSESPLKAKVTVLAKGDDVRSVLTNLFAQAKQQFVLAPNIRFVLYLSLDNMEFDRALTIVCAQAGLEAVKDDDVYFVRAREKSVAQKVAEKHAEVRKTLGPIPVSTLKHRISARYAKTDLKSVMDDLGRQANVKIDVSGEVPNYKIDAVLVNTSLRYALDMVCKAARLKYELTENQSIRVANLEDNRVSVASN